MRRPDRTINIFSVSALDLFASAMGAFIILTLILVPFYRNTARTDDIDAVRSALAEAQQELQSSESQLASCQEARGDADADVTAALAEAENLRGQLEQAEGQLADCRRRLNQTFLIVVMTWRDEGQDIDMHIFDPEGNHFFYDQTRYPGTLAELSFDNVVGPGVELWQHPSPTPGRYTICYHYFQTRRGARQGKRRRYRSRRRLPCRSPRDFAA